MVMPISNNRSPFFSKKPAIKAFVYSVAISCLYDNKPGSKETGNITQKNDILVHRDTFCFCSLTKEGK
jgi:hypothetical protein